MSTTYSRPSSDGEGAIDLSASSPLSGRGETGVAGIGSGCRGSGVSGGIARMYDVS